MILKKANSIPLIEMFRRKEKKKERQEEKGGGRMQRDEFRGSRRIRSRPLAREIVSAIGRDEL